MDARNLSGLRIAVYARYSSDNQREASIDDQVRRCREFVERAGGTVDPNLVFADHAVSGASLQRPAFEKLMALVNAKRRELDAIVTEDLSRVTRDFADAAMVFKQLQYLGVPLLGVADGIDTSARSAKLSFTVKSLLADMYLDELRDKTLRGLEGRALAGYSTGGLPYGYRSQEVLDAQRRVLGHAIEIDEVQAAVVRRLFRDYLGGQSLTGLAAAFNAEQVPPPRAHTLHRRKGWVASTVRTMLHNPAYTGAWSFKRKEWRKAPGTNRRRWRLRPEGDVLALSRPHLRIIDDDLWSEVQARLKAVRALFVKEPREGGRRRTESARSTKYLFSSILICDRCGAPMMISGGSTAKYYRCGDNHKRKTCPNALTVREDVAREALLAALRERLVSPEGVLHARKLIAEKLGELSRAATGKLREHEERLGRTEARIKGLVGFLADGDRSAYVVEALRDLEAQALTEKQAIASLHAQAEEPIPLPSPDELLERVFDLDARLAEDALRGREALRQLFHAGELRLVPQDNGVYLARAELLPLALFLQPPKAEDPAPEVSGAGSYRRLLRGQDQRAVYGDWPGDGGADRAVSATETSPRCRDPSKLLVSSWSPTDATA